MHAPTLGLSFQWRSAFQPPCIHKYRGMGEGKTFPTIEKLSDAHIHHISGIRIDARSPHSRRVRNSPCGACLAKRDTHQRYSENPISQNTSGEGRNFRMGYSILPIEPQIKLRTVPKSAVHMTWSFRRFRSRVYVGFRDSCGGGGGRIHLCAVQLPEDPLQ